MAVVSRMRSVGNDVPFGVVDGRKERVGFGRCVVDVGEIKFIRYGQALPVKACAAYDEYLFFGLTSGQGISEGGEDFRPGEREAFSVAKNDVASVGQGAFRKGLEGLSPHDNRVPCGESLEAPQVVGEVIEKATPKADSVVARKGDDDADGGLGIHQTDTLAGICGQGS